MYCFGGVSNSGVSLWKVPLYMFAGILSTRCSLGLDCIYLYYVAINEVNELMPIHVGYPPGQYYIYV